MLSKGKKIDLFNILKLTTSYIVQNNYNINISYEEACRNNYVVAIGDNQLLKFIRHIRKIDFNKEEIETLYKKRNELKLLPKSKKNYNDICRVQNEINEKLFVPDLISIKTDTTKKDYKYICKNKLNITIKINNHSYSYRYCRICAGAGQLRRNSAFFINEELHDDLIQLMMCGLTRKKIGKINLSKYGAYLALCTSAVRTVRTPRICVVDDFEYTLEKEKVRWITVNEDKSMELDDRVIDMEINAFDGSGMVSPEMAKMWADDMKLDYLPASFIIRGPWLKGLCSVFDFHKFAKEVAHKDVIIDHWGKEWPVNEIDVILTISQFKMYKRYESFDQYIYWYRRYNHSFGISRVSKKNSALQTQLNYQYIQSNSYTPETIKGLADYTINWLKNIMTGDRLYTMLFLVGAKNIDKDISQVVGESSNPYCKALMYDDTILEDSYFRKRINKMIAKKVDQAKIGKLFVEGDYEFIIPDLYAMAEHSFGMKPHGLLKSREMWSKRWNDKGSKEVSIMRSPLVSPCENQVLNLHDDEKCREWYKYIYSGNILNIWDTAAIRMSDADYDGDLALVTDNQYVVNAVDRTLLTITYAKNKTKEQYLNENSCANLDVRSFNSKIGFITNLASNFIAMLSDFSEDSDEYKELKRRIDLLRFYQGSAIDSTKGDVFTPPPKEWSRRQRYINLSNLSGDELLKAQEKNKQIAFENRICAHRKAYFFGYIYSEAMHDYKRYRKIYKQISIQKFGQELNELLKKPDKTHDEILFTQRYFKYLPLNNNNCIMNLLCRYVEDSEFDNKWKKSIGEYDYTRLMSRKYNIEDNKLIQKILGVVRELNRTQTMLSKNLSYNENYYDEDEEKRMYNYIYEIYENKLLSLCSNKEMLCDYVVYVFYKYFKNKSMALLWSVFSDIMIENLKNNVGKVSYPVYDQNGVEYLGEKYSIKEVTL